MLDLLGLSKFRGNAPSAPPPDKNIPAVIVLGKTLGTMTLLIVSPYSSHGHACLDLPPGGSTWSIASLSKAGQYNHIRNVLETMLGCAANRVYTVIVPSQLWCLLTTWEEMPMHIKLFHRRRSTCIFEVTLTRWPTAGVAALYPAYIATLD